MMDEIRVLFIDDDEEDFLIVKKYLSKIEKTKYIIERAIDYEEAIKKIKLNNHDVYLVDYLLGNKNGLDIVNEIGIKYSKKPFIFLTGQKNKDVDISAMEHGVSDYLVKDKIDPYILERTIRYAIHSKNLENEIIKQKILSDTMIETTSSGICLVEYDTDKIISSNRAFLDMFEFNRENIKSKKFHDLLTIKKYSENIYNKSTTCDHYCSYNNCECSSFPIECKVISKTGKVRECLLTCKVLRIDEFDIDKNYRVSTMTDITKQKRIEDKLIEATNILQEKVKKFGIDNENEEAILSLIDLEVDKLKNIEETSKQWMNS